MRAVVVVLLLSTAALADVAKPVADKVEEVDLDALDEDGPKAAGSTKIEEVKLDELEQAVGTIEYVRSRWLLLLPALCALIVMWNVDWRDVRLKAEIAAARAKRAPTKKGTKTW